MTVRDWWAMLSCEEETLHEVRFRFTDEAGVFDGLPPVESQWVRVFVPVEEVARFERLVDRPDEDCSVSFVPRRRPLPEGMQPAEYIGRSSVLWARLDNTKQMNRLRHFEPVPTVVLRHGGSVHRVALWWLSTPLNVVQVERANKRIAHALDCKKKWADPGHHFMVPGTVLRQSAPGRKACQVHVEWEGEGRYTLGEVVGKLKDAPDPWTPELRP